MSNFTQINDYCTIFPEDEDPTGFVKSQGNSNISGVPIFQNASATLIKDSEAYLQVSSDNTAITLTSFDAPDITNITDSLIIGYNAATNLQGTRNLVVGPLAGENMAA